MQFCTIYGCENVLRTEYEKVTGMCEFCRQGEPNADEPVTDSR